MEAKGNTVQKKGVFTFKNMRHMPAWMAGFMAFLVKMVSLTYRVKIDDRGGWYKEEQPSPAVISIWHNRFLFMACMVRRSLREKMSVLISTSRDGEYASTFIRFFGLDVVRGSSSRGGVGALLKLHQELENKRSVVLTVDGPRGPRYSVHPGVVQLSSKNRTPIVPVMVNAKHYWHFKSWDKTQIPIPFSSVTLVVGAPVYIPEGMGLEDAKAFVRDAMLEITED